MQSSFKVGGTLKKHKVDKNRLHRNFGPLFLFPLNFSPLVLENLQLCSNPYFCIRLFLLSLTFLIY